MIFGFCSKQRRVNAALREGRWPQACDSALVTHVAQCPACSDVVLVAQTLQRARSDAMQSARPISSEIIWWRRELQQRTGAIERATRPIAVVERVVLIALPIAMLALGIWQWDQLTAWLSPSWDSFSTLASGAALWLPLLLVASLGTFALVWGLVVFMVAGKDESKQRVLKNR